MSDNLIVEDYKSYPKFKGSKTLRPANIKIEYTAEQALELMKCMNDVIYFCENYLKIRTLDHGIQPFRLRKYQKESIELIANNKLVILKQGRQSGKTTVAAAVLVWLLLFNSQYEIGILANKEKQAKEILKRIKLYYELLPYWMQIGITAWNATSLEVESGSVVFAAASSPDSIRGRSLNAVFMDEFAILTEELAEELFTSTFPVISSGENTKFILASTPKGLNKFYKIWTEAKEGTNGFIPFEINYWDVPGRDAEWAKAEIARIGQAKFDQEYGAEFMGSSNTLIDGKKIPNIPYTNAFMKDPEENLHIFESPQINRQYVMSVDCSEGVGGDYSTFTIFDVSQLPYKVVATYANDMVTTLIFPNVIFDVAQYFNNAFVVIESNTIGAEVANILYYDLEYENVLSSNVKSKRGELDENPRSYLGIKTTKKTKHLGCSNLKLLIENDQLIVNDYRILYEMARFVKKGSSFAAQPGEHDDLMMNLVTFAWLTTQNSFKEITNTDLRIAMNQRTMNEQDYLPRGIFVNNGLNNEDHNGIPVLDDLDQWLLS